MMEGLPDVGVRAGRRAKDPGFGFTSAAGYFCYPRKGASFSVLHLKGEICFIRLWRVK